MSTSLTYTTVVTNNGPTAASSVVAMITMPQNSENSGVATTQGTFTRSGETVTANLGGLAAGASATITFQAFPFAQGLIMTTATTVIPR